MNFQIKKTNNAIIFTLNEKRLDAYISGLVKNEFAEITKTGNGVNLVIDLNKVESCDSSGLSALLVANRLVTGKSGALRIVTASPKIQTLIKITQLDKVLTLNSTVEEALSEI